MRRDGATEPFGSAGAAWAATPPWRARRQFGRSAEDLYLALTGMRPAEAAVDDDEAFDAHVFAAIIAVAAANGGAVTHAFLGLSPADFGALLDRRFPGARALFRDCAAGDSFVEDDEVAMVRSLLLSHRSTEGEDGRQLAAMIARRALESNHLWEDLGLRNRGELSRLLMRHFAPLAAQNIRNMRWKRFFYRMLCEADGMVLCAAPVCTDCADFELCFGEESGESALARNRRSTLRVGAGAD